MADYANWQTALSNWAIASTGLPVIWENEPRPSLREASVFVILSGPHSVDAVGQDWIEQVQDEPTMGEFTVSPQPRAVRIAKYAVRVVSRSQSPDSKAGRYLELARMGARLPVVGAAWRAVGMSLATLTSIRMFDAPGVNDRMESIASMELVVNLIPSDAPAGVDQGWLEKVELSSTLTPAATPPNLDAELIPDT